MVIPFETDAFSFLARGAGADSGVAGLFFLGGALPSGAAGGGALASPNHAAPDDGRTCSAGCGRTCLWVRGSRLGLGVWVNSG